MNASKFFSFIKSKLNALGNGLLLIALTAWYCATDPETPVHVKAFLFGDLAYLLSPVDAIPDVTLFIGFSDDLALLTATLAIVASHVKLKHKAQAKKKMGELLGSAA